MLGSYNDEDIYLFRTDDPEGSDFTHRYQVQHHVLLASVIHPHVASLLISTLMFTGERCVRSCKRSGDGQRLACHSGGRNARDRGDRSARGEKQIRSNYATWLGPSCKLCPAVAVVPCTQMYNSEVCHHQRGNKGVFCYQTFLKSICFLIHLIHLKSKHSFHAHFK